MKFIFTSRTYDITNDESIQTCMYVARDILCKQLSCYSSSLSFDKVVVWCQHADSIFKESRYRDGNYPCSPFVSYHRIPGIGNWVFYMFNWIFDQTNIVCVNHKTHEWLLYGVDFRSEVPRYFSHKQIVLEGRV